MHSLAYTWNCMAQAIKQFGNRNVHNGWFLLGHQRCFTNWVANLLLRRVAMPCWWMCRSCWLFWAITLLGALSYLRYPYCDNGSLIQKDVEYDAWLFALLLVWIHSLLTCGDAQNQQNITNMLKALDHWLFLESNMRTWTFASACISNHVRMYMTTSTYHFYQ